MSNLPKGIQQHRIPAFSWLGFFIMVVAQFGLILKVSWVATWLTPIMWTGYILFVDGLVFKRRGRSWLTSRKLEFPLLAFLSIGIWLLFEAYNFHIQNWLYRGVPESPIARDIAYGWSFSTILPAVFITSELVLSFLPQTQEIPPSQSKSRIPQWVYFLTGVTLVFVPVGLPVEIARYLFGAVWLGFIFVLDPINLKMGGPSLLQQWALGKRALTISLLIGGLLCGFLWEAWNFQAFLQAGGHWIYTVPDPLRIFDLHYGQMPLLGMLGFPPFALELYLMYHFLRTTLEIDRLLGPLDW